MRIALNAWFHEQSDTGSGQYTRNLISALKEISPLLDIQPVTPARRSNMSKVWFEQVEFPRAAEKMQAQIAFIPYWAAPMQCRMPVVVTVHDVIPLALPQYRGGPLQRLYTSLVRATSAKASAIITDSDYSRSDIERMLPVEKSTITAIPLAADPKYSPAVSTADIERACTRYDLPADYVLYLGGYDWRKNIETLLLTYRWCADAIGDEFPLVINGARETPVQTRVGKAVTLGDMLREFKFEDGRVRLIGRIAEEDKPALYRGARCFIFTSIYEGFGLPVLEAMACGTPVVGSNASSLPEVVGNAGMLVDPYDARSMAGAVIAVCSDDGLHDQLSQRGLLRAARFSWQRTALETMAVFNRVVTASESL